MKRLQLTMVITAALFSPAQAMADSTLAASDWDISVGIVSVSLPAYLGDNANRSRIAPQFSVNYKDRFFSSILGGLGYNVIKLNGWRAGPIAKYHGGRREDGNENFFIDDNETNDLLGLGDIKSTVEVGGFAEYTNAILKASLEIRQGIEGHKGAVGEASIQYSGHQMLGDQPFFSQLAPR